jgi:S-adenosyl-L-methionine hydrolase (adenosine-forming)
MIVVFTDFGPAGPYVAQMRARISAMAPGVETIELLSDAPAFDPRASAYLLAALAPDFPDDAVFLAVVDPGVGSDRPPVIVEADGRRFVGPGNGLFEIVMRRAAAASIRRIAWSPSRMSASFHGRDLFAPVAAMLAAGEPVPCAPLDRMAGRRPDWPDDLAEIVYVDHYGNAMTGLRAAMLREDTILTAGERRFARARVFSDVSAGTPFWYENANGLAEIAVSGGSAAALGLAPGTPITLSRVDDAI